MWISKIPSDYPKTLVKDYWIPWSEKVLSQQHDRKYTIPKGFQIAIDAEDADERTRAGELFIMGLLRGPLVNGRKGGVKGSIPYGWNLIQDDHHVHTRLGYLAYSIGKVMQQDITSPAIERAFNVLCTIFVLQMGFQTGSHYILLPTLFNYLLDNFVPSVLVDPQKWQRYLAASMVCTLSTKGIEDAKEVDTLVNRYVTGQPVSFLFLRFNNNMPDEKVGPDELVRKIEENMSISLLVQQKSSLYWIGGEDGQGFYTKASFEGLKFIQIIGSIERNALAKKEENPFKILLKANKEEVCVLEQLDNILELYPAARKEWKRMMQTLREGVTEALRFVERVEVSSKRVFFGHDIETADLEGETLNLKIEREKLDTLPQRNEIIVLKKQKYIVQQVEEHEDHVAILVSRQSISPLPHMNSY